MTDKQIDPEFVRRYARLIKPSVDVRDWAAHYDGRPTNQQTNAQLWKVIDGRRRPCVLSNMRLAEHLAGRQTCYFRTARSVTTAMLMIDIDAHHGETDAWDLAEHLRQSLFPGAFLEPSTNLRGFHLFVRVEMAGSRSVFNQSVRVVEQALNRVAIDHNFESSVELKGTCTLLHYDLVDAVELEAVRKSEGNNGRARHARKVQQDGGSRWLIPNGVRSRGSLAKLPRLKLGMHDLETLEAMPTWPTEHLASIAADAEMSDAWDMVRQGLPAPRLDRDAIAKSFGVAGLQTPVTTATGSRMGNKTSDGIHAPLMPKVKANEIGSDQYVYHTGSVAQWPDDAFDRTRTAAFVYGGRLGRVPTIDELYDFYVSNGLARGTDEARRRRRIADVIGWVAGVFDAKVSKGGFESRLPALLHAIATHAKPEHRANTCYDRKIADRELAVLLYAVERSTFDLATPPYRRYTLPRESVEALADRLRADGVRCGRWPKRKFYAARDILTRSRLIYRQDACHLAAGPERGVAHRYHIGIAHPLDRAFRESCRVEPPLVVTVKQNRYRLSGPYDGKRTEITVDVPATFNVPDRAGRKTGSEQVASLA